MVKILVSTVGEVSIFDTIESIKEHANRDYRMIIWYSCVEPFNQAFFDRLRAVTPDVIVSTSNKSVAHVFGSLLIYEKYDYFVNINPDNIVNPKFMDKVIRPFEENEKVAVSGGIFADRFVGDYILDMEAILPDEILMLSREAVNELGAHGAFFGTYGHEIMEFMPRAMKKGWHIASVKGLGYHNKELHAGRDKHKNLEELIDINTKVFYQAKNRGFEGYNWFSDRIGEKVI